MAPPTDAIGSITRSAEPSRFQPLLLRSVIPELSVTTTGSWRPGNHPTATVDGAVVRVIATSVLGPFGPLWRMQTAFVPHLISATVFLCAPAHWAGPEFVAVPQSLSVSWMTAFAVMNSPQPPP